MRGDLASSSCDTLRERAATYNILSSFYLEMPTLQIAECLLKGVIPFPDELRNIQGYPDLEKGLSLIADWIERCPKGSEEIHSLLKQEFTRLFVGPRPKPAPPYESVYRDKLGLRGDNYHGLMMGESVDRAKLKYAQAGIHKSEEWHIHPDDHLGVELAFMGYLYEKVLEQEEKTGAEIIPLVEMQIAFLTDHLLQWVPRFSEDLFQCEEADFYKGIAKVTNGFLMVDLMLLKQDLVSERTDSSVIPQASVRES